jgi:uncharacterized RDD family membrane protein YckC
MASETTTAKRALHHRAELFGARLWESLASIPILVLALVPFFAFRVLGGALGGGPLSRMFFVAREPMDRR